MPKLLESILKKEHRIKPGQTLVIGFFLVILTGAILLTLPISATEGNSVSFLDALFTSTSAVCVTGLIVVNTGVVYSVFGQIVIILLIQIGGLGFMTVASMLFLMVGKRISLRERLVIQEAYNLDSIQGVVRLVQNALKVTFTAEAIGAVILSTRMIPQFGVAKGLYHSVFLAVSAFCNAGFDALGQENSITEYVADPIVNITIMLLITIGGLGFAVVMDIIHHRRFRKLMLHSRIVLIVSGSLFVSAALLFGILEWNNPGTMGKLSTPVKSLACCFQSVTMRTAGFDTIGQGNLTDASKLITSIYMFIGASPASTGGGIKTTTFYVVMLAVISTVRGKQDYNVGNRRLGEQLIRKSFAILSLALCLVLVDTVTICAIENVVGGTDNAANVLYEVVSAFGTVGLSTGITAGLHSISKILLILTMFAGRLGPLTLSMALSNATTKPDAVHFPEDKVMVG